MKYTAIIVDDEQDAIDVLYTYLSNYFPNIEVIGTSQVLDEAAELISNNYPDLLLLDIKMQGTTSFDLLEKIELPSKTHLVFTTAFHNYAIKAINVEASGYLLKPIYPKMFKEVVQKVLEKINDQRSFIDLQTELEPKFAIPLSKKFKLTNLAQIVYCESDGRYTNFYMTNDRKFTSTKTLKEIEQQLESDDFIRIHQSFLINTIHISEFRFTSNEVLMSDDIKLPVSRSNKSNLKSKLQKGRLD